MTLATGRLRKGQILRPADIAALDAAGITEVTVAQLGPDDLGEDEAAAQVAEALGLGFEGLTSSAPFTGRVNVFAERAGLIRVDAGAIDALNRVDPAITLATLPDWARAQPRQMVATVKVIPYGVAEASVRAAVETLSRPALRLLPFQPGHADLILTRTPGQKESLLRKGAQSVRGRLDSLGITLGEPVVVAHEIEAVAGAIESCTADMLLILGGSATSDANDVVPRGLIAAGGEMIRFGMPVDPGNLLFLGQRGGRPVIGLPGCARSPALNGADWVLERIAAGVPVTALDVAGMGVGGLLKEIPSRPQPRSGTMATGRPRVAVILLAAGAGRRMRGADKLLEHVAGEPILRHAARAALASRADDVLVVLPPEAPDRRAALDGLTVRVIEAREHAEGMAASLRAGLAALADRTDAVVVMLADMPEVGPDQIDRLIAAHDPAEGRDICRAVAEDGTPGHPVLFGRRFFESLAALTGDRGAREMLREAAEFVTDVPTPGQGAVIDLDTPEEWSHWRARA